MTLGQQIKAARRAKNVRQHTIATELGVTVQAVSQWERDKTVPSQMNLMKLSQLLDEKFDGLEALRQIPLFAKPATYAPLLSPYPTYFYGTRFQEDDSPFDDLNDFVDFIDHGKNDTEMVPVTWEPAGNIFAMRVEDTSMSPDFMPGDIVIFDAGLKPHPGDFVIAQTFPSKGGLFRKYRLREIAAGGAAIVDLAPLNSDFPTLTITTGSTSETTGEITACLREVRRTFREK